MHKRLLTLSFLLYCIATTAQHTMEGRVVSGDDGQPVSYAQLYFPQLSQVTQADEAGYYRFNNLPEGDWVLEVSSISFIKSTATVLVYQNIQRHFNLQPQTTELQEAEVNGRKVEGRTDISLRKIEGTAIYASKKSELIEVRNMVANLSNNTARQVLARVPGINVWESDAAGLQLGVGARGLSPDRTSNFNMRQNGYDIAADALGYPESYYAPPMQALERIEIVRGAASLQYGTQFGGMINLKMKQGSSKHKISGSSIHTYNSIGHFNTFNEVGGQLGKTNYYAFINHRFGNSFRANTNFRTTTFYTGLGHQLTEKLHLKAEYTHMHYLAQQAGGLTDVQFAQDPYQSLRSRNWFLVNWNLFALTANYTLNKRTQIDSRFFGLLGSRQALGNLNTPVRQDARPYTNRDLLVDHYKNIGNETRFLHRYRIKRLPSAFLAGIRYYQGFTQKQQGFGSAGSSADFNFVTENRNLLSDYRFPSQNTAVFTENVFTLSDRLSITPGLRYEYIRTRAEGFYDSSVRIPLTGEIVIDSITEESRLRERHLLLAGLGASYQLSNSLELYGNFSQNYRAITFNNLRVVSPAFAVDENLQDEKGFNTDLGVRGNLNRWLSLDAGVFLLSYRDRIGSVLTKVQDNLGNTRIVRYTTNISDARILGLETYLEVALNPLMKWKSAWRWVLFSNLALIDARYVNSAENGIQGNQVEAVPEVNLKSGVRLTMDNFGVTYQFSYVSAQFSDASNAASSGDGLVGIVPAYWVMDFSLRYSYRFLQIEGGVNNFTNNTYFTRRAIGYPGPGIIPSAPLNAYLGLGVRF